MKLGSVRLGAAGSSIWLVPNQWLKSFLLGLGLTFDTASNLTASVQHTFDDPMQTPRTVTYTRAATVLTVTDANHGLAVGDNVQFDSDTNGQYNGAVAGPGTGGLDVASVTDANTYTLTVANAGAAAGSAGIRSFRVFNNAALGNVSGNPPVRADGNYSDPIGAVRLKVSAYTAGAATLTVQQGQGG